jgi:hypothetical protein
LRLQQEVTMVRFKRWSSRTGIATLFGILRRELTIEAATTIPGVQSYEILNIQRAMWRPARRGGKRPRHGMASARRLADELDVMRADTFSYDYLDRLENPRFRGQRAHLVRLLAYQQRSEQWASWRRRTGAVPDLRGADLHGLDLRYVDLRHARLQDAGLEGAIIRTGNLEHADLRGCRMRHADLSYAYLQHADLRRAELKETLLTGAHLEHADLRKSWLIGCFMNQALLQGTDLRGAVLWGVPAWDVETDRRTRDNDLLVVPGLDPIDYDEKAVLRSDWAVRVHGLEVAHFVTMLINTPKIGRVINAAAERIVLLLGRFVDEESQAVLEALKVALPRFGFVPVVFDFDEPDNRDTIETVAILAGLSTFVIADLSRPKSTPLEAHLIIPAIAVPFVPIVRAGEEQFSMFTALQRKYSWVLPTVKYRSAAGLVKRLRRDVIGPAQRAARRIRLAKHPRTENA